MPYDLGPGALAWLAVACLVAGFVRGYSGFGFSALVVSAAALVTHPLNFFAVVMLCGVAIIFQQWTGIAHDVDW